MTDESRHHPSDAVIELADRYEQALKDGSTAFKDGSTRAELEAIRLAAHDLGPEAATWFDRAVATLEALRRASLFESLSDGGPSVLGGEWDDSDETGVPPTRVGRFEVRRTLGQGGFGTVYLAWDPTLRREVALKVAHARTLHSAESRKRFLREAHIAARLDHPNLIPVYEAGEADGVPFIASVYCRGQTLGDWLTERRERGRGEPVPSRLAARIARDLAEGMAHAHAAGVLHRDLKPNNVLLEERPSSTNGHPGGEGGGPGFVLRITDFGLARAAALETEDGADRWTETRSGAVLGTLRYMAPEQAMGRVREIGPAADVYSLGVILYQMMTGRVPFERDTEFDTVQAIAKEEPPSMRSSRRDSPRDLEAICLKCLEKDPRRRYATARELADDLARYLAGEPVRARLPSPLERGVKWVKRRPVATLLGLVLLVTFGLGAVAWNLRTEREQANALAHARAVEQSRTQYVSDMRIVSDGLAELERGRSQPAKTLCNLLANSIPRDGRPDSRGFEWYYFWEKLHLSYREFVGHSDAVWDVDWSADGRLMASAGRGSPMRIWDAQTTRLLHSIAIPEGCSSVAFSPRGDLLAVGSDKGPIHFCAVGSWEVIATLQGHTTDVDYVRFIDGGRTLISVGLRDGTLRRWDVDGRTQTGLVNTGIKEAWTVHVAPDEKTAVVAGAHGIRLFDLATLAITGQRDLEDTPRGTRFSPDGRYFAVSSIEEGQLVLFETATFQEVTRWRDGSSGSAFIEFTADGRRVISACGPSLYCWDRETGQLESAWAISDEQVVNCERTPDGTKFLVTDEGGKMFLLDAELPSNPREVWSIGHTCATDVQWSPDGTKIAVSGPAMGVEVLDKASLGTLRTFSFPKSVDIEDIVRSAFSPDGTQLVTCAQTKKGSNGGRVYAWSLENGEIRWEAKTERSTGNCKYTSDGRYVLATHYDGCSVFDSATGARLHELSNPDQHIYLHPGQESSLLYVWKADGMHEWNLAVPGGELKLLWSAGSRKYVQCIFSPDGAYVAQGLGGQVEVKETLTGKLLFSVAMGGVSGPGGFLDFAPDGRTLVGLDPSQKVHFWRMRTGDEVASHLIQQPLTYGYVGCMMRFSPDGSQLLTLNSGLGTSETRARLLLWNAPRVTAVSTNP